MYKYDVDIHFSGIGWDTYTVNADCVSNARYMAVIRVINETGREHAELIDCVKIYKHGTQKLIKQYDTKRTF